MNNLVERAKELFQDAFDADELIPAREGYIVKIQREAYIKGATEQRDADIEKACEWLKNSFEGGGYVQDWQIEEFIKAMKGE